MCRTTGYSPMVKLGAGGSTWVDYPIKHRMVRVVSGLWTMIVNRQGGFSKSTVSIIVAVFRTIKVIGIRGPIITVSIPEILLQ